MGACWAWYAMVWYGMVWYATGALEVPLVIGIWMLYRGIRALVRRAFVGGIIWLFLGLLVLGWLMR